MTFNPFPWHKPAEDRRSHRLEPLVGGGLGRPQPPERPAPAMVFALVAGVALPLGVLVVMLGLLLKDAPLGVQIMVGAVVASGALVVVLRARATRARAAARPGERAARRAAPDVIELP